MMPEQMPGPVQGQAPPDQQPRQLLDLLVELDAMIWHDGMQDPQERQQMVMFLTVWQMKNEAAARGEMVRPGLEQMGQMGQQPTQQQGEPEGDEGEDPNAVSDYGSGAGSPIEQGA